MLTINTEKQEFYLNDGDGYRFFHSKPAKINLEHSLISVSKWEGIWKKPYLPVTGVESGIISVQEELSYISCMIIGKVGDLIPTVLRTYHTEEITDYINDQRTATKIYRLGNTPVASRTTVTSELVYYWMIKFGIPFQFEKWHFNRLLTLIDVCNIKENEGRKGGNMSSIESAKHRTQLNKMRRAQG